MLGGHPASLRSSPHRAFRRVQADSHNRTLHHRVARACKPLLKRRPATVIEPWPRSTRFARASLTYSIPFIGTNPLAQPRACDLPIQLDCCAYSNTYLKVLTCRGNLSHDVHDVITEANTETRARPSRQEGMASSRTVCSRSGAVVARRNRVGRSTGP